MSPTTITMRSSSTHRKMLSILVNRHSTSFLPSLVANATKLECSRRCNHSLLFFSTEASAISKKSSSANEFQSKDDSEVERMFRLPPALERPDLRVSGVKKADLESNKHLASFFEINFPEEDDISYCFHRNGGGGDASLEQQSQQQQQKELRMPIDYNIREIFCFRRYVDGSRICRRLRYHKLIPGVLYGGDPTKNIHSNNESKVLVLTPHNEIHRERDRWGRYFSSRVYDLTVYPSKEEKEAGVEGEVVRVIPQDVQIHPIKNNVYCVNYLRYFPGRPIAIPIKYVNEEESPILKRGGFIVPINRQLKCVIDDGVPIPEYLELDCTGAKSKEKLGLSRIAIPEGVKLVKDINTTTWFHGSVFGKG